MKKYNDILKDALWEIKEEEIVSLPEENEIDYEFSDEFKKKMDLLIKAKPEKKKNHYGVLKKIAVIAIIFISLLAITTTKAGAKPLRIFDFIFEYLGNHISIYHEPYDETLGDDTTYTLSYIPEGYKEIGFKKYAFEVKKLIYEKNENSGRITLEQSNSDSMFTTTIEESEECTINGISVLIIKNRFSYRAIWSEKKYYFTLTYPIELGKDLIYENVGNLIVRNENK